MPGGDADGERARRLARRGALAAAAALTLAVQGAGAASAPAPELQASVTPGEIQLGAGATVAGTLTLAGSPLAGRQIVLESSPYPYRAMLPVARTVSGAGGTFAFAALHPQLNTRLRVLAEGQPPTALPLAITVDPRVQLSARELGAGRTQLTLRVRYGLVPGLAAAPLPVRWFVATPGSRSFQPVALTSAGEPRPGLLQASAVVDPPARQFRFRVCLNPSWEAAMGPPATHGRCPTGAFLLPAHGRR